MEFSQSCLLEDAEMYESEEQMDNKYSFNEYTFSQDFIHMFVHWFFACNIPQHDSTNRGYVCSEARLLLDALFLKGLRYDKALDKFSDLVEIDRMAWRTSMYCKSRTDTSSNGRKRKLPEEEIFSSSKDARVE